MKVKIIKKRFAQHSNVSQVEDLFIYLSERVSVKCQCDEWGGAESRGNGARPVE